MSISPEITPPARGSDPENSPIDPSQAATLLVAASAADLETEDGGVVEAWTISAVGDIVEASGPRLQLWAGMQLWWRFLDEQGHPYRAELHVLEARFNSNSRARLRLQVIAVAADRSSRQADRCIVSGSALLTAVNCERIVDTDRMHAALHDLSASGVGLVLDDDRVRPGDRFVLRVRFMEGTIDTDVRVARVVPRPGGGGVLIGAFYLHPTPQLVDIVERVNERFGTHRRADPSDGIRDSLGMVPEGPRPQRTGLSRPFPAFSLGPEPA
jgi:hypothetical protein